MGVDWYSEEKKRLHEWSDTAVMLDVDWKDTVEEARKYLHELHGDEPFSIGLDIGSWGGQAGAIASLEEAVGGPLIIPRRGDIWKREILPYLQIRIMDAIRLLKKERWIRGIKPMARARLTVEKVGKMLEKFGLRGIISEHLIIKEAKELPFVYSDVVLKKLEMMRDFVTVIKNETQGGIVVSY
jgi:hypothetical protein